MPGFEQRDGIILRFDHLAERVVDLLRYLAQYEDACEVHEEPAGPAILQLKQEDIAPANFPALLGPAPKRASASPKRPEEPSK